MPGKEGEEDLLKEDRKLFTFRGQVKNLSSWYRTDAYSLNGEKKDLAANLTRLRLSPELNYEDRLAVNMDYDNEVIFSNYLPGAEFDGLWRYSQYNDLMHLSWEPHRDSNPYYRTKIYRAYAKLVVSRLTVTLGRQQIRFGSGRLWNPLDILNPVSPTALEGSGEQKGTDALRAEYYFTPTTELALVYDQKRLEDDGTPSSLKKKNGNFIGRFKTTAGRTEMAALGGRVSRRRIGGADISGILLDGTIRGSVIHSSPEDQEEQGPPFTQASAGYEYNFRSGLYILVEYFYNQNGINFNEKLRNAFLYQQVFGVDESNYYILSNQFLTYNRHYAGVALGYDITPLMRGELFTIYDFEGRGVFLAPAWKYNIYQNMDITLSVMKACLLEKEARYASDFEYLKKYPLLFGSLVWYF
mgnify:CR=1 FL=1